MDFGMHRETIHGEYTIWEESSILDEIYAARMRAEAGTYANFTLCMLSEDNYMKLWAHIEMVARRHDRIHYVYQKGMIETLPALELGYISIDNKLFGMDIAVTTGEGIISFGILKGGRGR